MTGYYLIRIVGTTGAAARFIIECQLCQGPIDNNGAT